MAQCAILYVTTGVDENRLASLRALGFKVEASDDLPPNESLTQYHAVVVHAGSDCHLPMLAARLRAKPRFGRRVLVALVDNTMAERERRDAMLSGFDEALPANCGVRDLAATIVRLLRPFPEFRCLLRNPSGRRKAA